MTKGCAKTLLQLKLLVNAEAWQILEKNETYILCPYPPVQKNVPAPLRFTMIISA